MVDTSSTDWVSEELGRAPQPEMPEWVARQLDAVIASEVARWQRGETAADSKADYDEIKARSDLGTFGKNVPTHFDKSGLGLSDRYADH